MMIVMSVAISLVSIQSLYFAPQSGSSSSRTPEKSRVQQEKKDATYPTILNLPSTVSINPVALPPGDNAWAVQIVSRGGYTGSGRGDLTLTSDGMLIWDGEDGACSRKVPLETISAITKVVLSVGDSASFNELAPTGMCAHCYVTAMIVQRRGVEDIVRASWDNVTQAKVPAALFAVYESLMAEGGCKRQ